jgi:Kef-type K+ transport system membrane component KefB
MGLFFMSVGMEISMQLFLAKWKEVLAGITILIVGKASGGMRGGGCSCLGLRRRGRSQSR